MVDDRTDAVVVGAGPNGLAAAVVLAREGYAVTVLEAADTIGGGTRTAELTVPGVLHDICSAVHPFSVASPFFQSLPLAEHGLTWCYPEIDLTHPLDDGRVGVMVRSLDDTVAAMGGDAKAWRRTFGPIADHLGDLTDDLFRPILHVPSHPLRMARFGLDALQPASLLARRFDRDEVRALFAGAAAHVIHPLNRPATASVALMLLGAGHHVGWPVAAGGSRSITDALAAILLSHGGTIETGVRVRSMADLPSSTITIFDTGPKALLDIAGSALPDRVRRAYRRYRHGPGAFKVDLAVEGGVPWADEPSRSAGTVHLGGTFEQVAAGEKDVHDGRMPEQPFVLAAQQYLADPSRSAGDVHPIWAYCHVPSGWEGDATDAVIDQIERFAPGTRDRIVGVHSTGARALETYNANYVGGDIATGANDPWQVVIRPRLAVDPYATGIDGVFIASAATPPGAGIHGMCGYNAAQSALKVLRRS